MSPYYEIKAIVPTTIPGGVRKITVEVMPQYMSYFDAVYDKNNGFEYIENEQGYQKGYDERTAKELFQEIYAKAISFEYIRFFEMTKSGFLKHIEGVKY